MKQLESGAVSGGADVSTKWAVTPLAVLAAMLMLIVTAAVPGQDQGKRPSQPLLQDFYSGTATVQGSPAPTGTLVVACVDDCETYQSAAVTVGESGSYAGLMLEPTDHRMIGRDVTFHIVNQHGSIQASETSEFYGVYDLYTQNLTFDSPLPAPATPTPTPTATPVPTATPEPTATPTPEPTEAPTPTPVPDPTPTAILPVTGDTTVTRIPPLAIVGGIALVLVGGGLLYAAARRARA